MLGERPVAARPARNGNGNWVSYAPVAVLTIWFLLESATGVKSGWWGCFPRTCLAVLFQWLNETSANEGEGRQAESYDLRKKAPKMELTRSG